MVHQSSGRNALTLRLGKIRYKLYEIEEIISNYQEFLTNEEE